MVKFLHTADWQLGMTRHFLSGEAQPRFDAARVDVVRRVGALAVEEGCGFVVVCGDVFESNQVGRQVVGRALEAMAATPEVTFYLLPGNHDPLDASSVFTSPTFEQSRPANVIVLNGSDPVEVVPGVELVPAPWFSKRPLVDLVAEACDGLGPAGGGAVHPEPSGRPSAVPYGGVRAGGGAVHPQSPSRPPAAPHGGLRAGGGAVRIVVGHGALDTLWSDPDNPAVIALAALEERLDSGLIHYVALGDRHSTTDAGRTGRVWYSGAPEPTDYTETDPGNVLIVDLDSAGARVESRPVGKWRFVQRDWDLTGDADLDALDEWLRGLEHKERTVVKLSLVGQISLAQKARLDNLLEHHADLLAALETWERRSDLVVVAASADLDHLGLSGFAQEALEDLRRQAEPSHPGHPGDSGDSGGPSAQAITAQDALALLYRLAGAGQ